MSARPLVVVSWTLLLGVLVSGCGPTPGSPPQAENSAPTAPTLAPATPAPTTPPSSASPSTPSAPPTPTSPVAGLPRLPDPSRPAAWARQLASAGAVLHDPDAAPGEVRRAAEFWQLSARTLARQDATAPVLARLPRRTRGELASDVRAATLLGSLTEPQPQLPPWRILPPPPARVLLSHYQEAERVTGTPWEYLAAVHLVETRMGRIRGPSTAGALGPMQFLPSTWAAYGAGGDIEDPRDSILAAGRLLAANGAPEDLAGALWNYNHSEWYVGAVTAYAERIEADPLAYRGYWHWRVLYKHVDGTYLLPPGYPDRPEVLVEPAG